MDDRIDSTALWVRDETGNLEPATSQQVRETALALLEQHLKDGPALQSPGEVRDYLRLKLGGMEHEVFAMVLLDAKHHVLAYEELFRGTIDGCAVHPREVVKLALSRNAAAVILVHNHPSGVSEPSASDLRITERLQNALALIDVRVVDHLVVGAAGTTSFAERQLL